MKNTTNASLMRLFGIIAIAAIIGLSFTACGGGGGGGVKANARYRHNANLPPNLSVALSAGPIGGTTVNDASYSGYTTFYETTKQYLIEAVTPTAFKTVEYGIQVRIPSGNPSNRILNQPPWGNIDFAQGGTTLAMQDHVIEEGDFITEMVIDYGWHGGTTTFTVNKPVNSSHPWRANPSGFNASFTNEYKTITIPTDYLFPLLMEHNTPVFFYSGNEYRFNPSLSYFGWAEPRSVLVTPWAGVTVPAGIITFNVNWNLNNLIEQRCSKASGHTDHATTGCADCVYVLKNKFWEGFSLTIN